MSCQVTLTMTINCLWNKRCGPGGGTRRLHHIIYGDEIGSTRVVKVRFSFGMAPSLSG